MVACSSRKLEISSYATRKIKLAVVGSDPQGWITSWNPGAKALFGYSEQEMLGQSMLTLFRQNG